MVWLTLGISIVALLVALALSLLTVPTKYHRAEMETLRMDHREQRRSWEVERERLLNRAMTKDWESYTQMTGAMQTQGFTSEPGIGLSDEREAQMWAEQHAAEGLGDVFATIDDAEGLGLQNG